MTETPGARAGFLQVPPTSPFFSHTAHALLHRHLRARPRSGAASRARLPTAANHSFLQFPGYRNNSPWAPWPRPLWICFPPFVLFAQSLASECSLGPASPPPPS